ncbi:Squamous cell carcinoma antigen recognized by T-cells 3 [Blomia tropicalis]|nr:Squamous cell carcinoma antigen recognized by T-cells 3 [Blomia tropicalis]
MDFTKIEDDNDSNSVDDDNSSMEGPSNLDIEMENDEDTDDSDSDENDSDDENEALLVEEVNRLQEELSHNPFDYEKHVSLIEKLRSIGELDILREAREKMNKLFPLSAKLWLEWLQDEEKIATTTEQKLAILDLYERAVNDYLDCTVNSNYIFYLIELYESSLVSIDRVRNIFEQTLTRIGCSVIHGTKIWQYYRLLETNILSGFDLINENNRETVQQQIKLIFDIFSRQLSIPLVEMEKNYQQFEEWLDHIKTTYGIDLRENEKQQISRLKIEYEKSLKTLESLKVFEDKLQHSQYPHYQEYLNYIDEEIKNDNLSRTQCLFERAINDNCLQAELWLKYLKFCDRKFVVDTILLPIYERALRNCPWIVDIWLQYMISIERLSSKDLENVLRDVLDRACKNTFDSVDSYKRLWLYYINFTRRDICKNNSWNNDESQKKIRDLFDSILIQLEQMSNLDYCYDLYRYYAKVEAQYCSSIQNCRKIFNDLTKKSPTLKRQASFWIDWAIIEQRFGGSEDLRKVLYRGLEMCLDYPETIGDFLLRYEQEEGENVERYSLALNKIEFAIKKKNTRAEKEAKIEEMKVKEDVAQNNNRSLKRKAEKTTTETNLPKKPHIETDKSKLESEPSKPAHGVFVKTDDAKREQTIFLSNLNYDLTEDDIRECFVQFGPINEVRLVRDFKGRSKGFCYVEYERIESARTARKNDRLLLRERPVFISEMDKRNKFNYSTNKENNKIFVKNIPFEMTKDDLIAQVFSNYSDSIIDCRLITFKNGHSKGLAYIECKNASIAEKIVKEKNDFEVGDRKLFVAISDPSVAKTNSLSSSVPFSKSNPARTGTSNLMIPHSLMAKSHPSKVKMQLTTDGPSTSKKNGQQDTISNKNLSNDQFRSMFLN